MIDIFLMFFRLFPLALGAGLNWYMMTFTDKLPPVTLIAFVTLALWALAAFLARPYRKKTWDIVAALNTVPFLVRVLLGVQELVLHAYWPNAAGLWPQYY